MNKQRLKAYEELLLERTPGWYRWVFNRPTAPPNGFPSAKPFAVNCASGLVNLTLKHYNGEELTPPALANVASVLCWAAMKNPTYYVEQEFAQSVWKTRIPGDMPIRDLKFPMDSMLFVLPHGFTKPLLHANISHILVTRLPQGRFPQSIGLPQRLTHDNLPLPVIDSPDQKSRLIISFTAETDTTLDPVSYVAYFNIETTIKEVYELSGSTSIKAYRSLVDDGVAESADAEEILDSVGGLDGEAKMMAAVNQYALGLVLAMVSMPQQVEVVDEPIRKPKTKGKHYIPGLWGPNRIGRSYRLQYAPGYKPAGHHASPVWHWRKGHFRHQHWGRNNQLVKVIWIEPTIVNPPENHESDNESNP